MLKMLEWDSIVANWNSLTTALTTMSGQPLMILGMIGVLIIGTNMIGTFLATPLGIGIVIGVIGALYVITNYGKKQPSETENNKK
jgi:hypothetical protein